MASIKKIKSQAGQTQKKTPKLDIKPKTDYTRFVGLAIILLVVFLVYLPSLENGFTNWDDDDYVTENSIILNPGNTTRMIQTPVAGNYHPLTMYSLALDWKISSKKVAEVANDRKELVRAKTFHTTNLLIHLLNTALVFFFIWLLSEKRMWVSLVCALFFGIHPMHVESVAWIAERKDVLYTFFFLIALITYILYGTKKNSQWLGLCYISFILSLASKPAAVVLPITLWAIDFFQSRKIDRMMVMEKIPFLIVSLLAGLLTIKAQLESQAFNESQHFNFFEKFLFGSYGTMMYFIKLIFPLGLSNFYPYPDPAANGLPLVYYLSPIIVIFSLGMIYYFARNQKVIWFGLAFFFIHILLVLQFFTVGQAIMADRYTYVPYIGLFFIMGWWLDGKTKFIGSTKVQWRHVLFTALGLLGIVYTLQTYQRVKVWKDSETLWTDAIAKSPQPILVAHNNRGHALRRKAGQALAINNKALGEEYLAKAMMDFNTAILFDAGYALAWANKGNIFLDKNQNDSADYYYTKALSLNNDLWEVYVNRGAAKAKAGDFRGSIEDLSLALKRDPYNRIALENRAICYASTNDHTKSLADYQKLLLINPNDYNIRNAVGVGFQSLNKYRQSITEFDLAIRLAPNIGEYYLNRSYSWKALGDNAKANLDMQTAKSLGVAVPGN